MTEVQKLFTMELFREIKAYVEEPQIDGEDHLEYIARVADAGLLTEEKFLEVQKRVASKFQ